MYIWEKYRTFEITSSIILKMNLPLYKGFTLEITNKWWPLTTMNRWPLYRIKIYSKMHRESTKVTVMSRWPLYKGDRYDRFDCTKKNYTILQEETITVVVGQEHFFLKFCEIARFFNWKNNMLFSIYSETVQTANI